MAIRSPSKSHWKVMGFGALTTLPRVKEEGWLVVVGCDYSGHPEQCTYQTSLT